MASIYYDISRLLSYNSLFSFVVGERGCGKTYQFKDWAIRDFLKNGKQFIYVRRYKTELKDIAQFFDDIVHKYPDVEFSIKNGKFYINKQVAGYYIALSTSVTKKSVPYPKVNKIGYDEFILEKSNIHYLPNEVEMFLGLYKTVDRDRDNVRCVFMANAVTIMNPYFLYFGIKPNKTKRFYKYCEGEIVVELTDLEEFRARAKTSRLSKIIGGTDYEKYSVDNEFINDNYEFIENKTKNSYYLATFYYKNAKVGLWCDNRKGLIYATSNIDETFPIRYSLTTEDHKPNQIMLSNANKSDRVKSIRKCYDNGLMRFESLAIKNTMYEIFRVLAIAKF